MYVCVHVGVSVCVYLQLPMDARKGCIAQELQAVVSYLLHTLRTKLWSSAREANTFNC